ncbi:MAG: hypothetical protein IPM38_14140 [Ignavibacteria bacterium]|nr:hypothetical protein [Ignavibacteria bacterium]
MVQSNNDMVQSNNDDVQSNNDDVQSNNDDVQSNNDDVQSNNDVHFFDNPKNRRYKAFWGNLERKEVGENYRSITKFKGIV